MSLPPLYFNIVIIDRTFDIHSTDKKPFPNQCTLKSLRKFEEVIQDVQENKLEYTPPLQREGLTVDQVVGILYHKSRTIFDSYRRKYAYRFWKGNEEKEVHAVFIRIEKLMKHRVFDIPGRVQLPNELCIYIVVQFCNLPTLGKFARLTQHARSLVEDVTTRLAQSSGCEKNNPEEARNFLRRIFQEIRGLMERKIIPDWYFSYEQNRLNFRNILRGFRSLTVDELFDLFSSVPMYPSMDAKKNKVPPLFINLRKFFLANERFFRVPRNIVCDGLENVTMEKGAVAMGKAAANRDSEVMEFLLRAGLHFNDQGIDKKTALTGACESEQDNGNLVKSLLERGADSKTADAHGHLPIHCASLRLHLESMRLLLGVENPPVNVPGGEGRFTPLCYVCNAEREDVEAARLLLAHKADPNLPAGNGSCPIHFATQRGYFGIVSLLLKHEANVNYPGADGLTPLCFACAPTYRSDYYRKNREVVRALLEAGADPNIPSNEGNSPLCWAVQAGCADFAALLISKRGNVHVRGERNKSALHFACEKTTLDHLGCVSLLLQFEVNPNIISNDGETPLDIINRNIDFRGAWIPFEKILKQYGGKKASQINP